MQRRLLSIALTLASLSIAGSAAAQEDKDGVRFRGGVAGTFGGLFGSKEGIDYTGFLGGVDGHIGVQIMDLIGVYAVPHLSAGSVTATFAGFEASDGWIAFSGTGVVDFTFIDQIFVGVGGGFSGQGATCTNCSGVSGPVLHFRVGGYPLMGYGDDGIRRQGLMVGADLRVNFLTLSVGTLEDSIILFQPMLSIGYEAY